MTLCPKIQQTGGSLLLYYVHDKMNPGFFFKINSSLGAMIVECKVKETGIVPDEQFNFTQTTNPGDQEIEYQWFNYPPPYRRYLSLKNASYGGIR